MNIERIRDRLHEVPFRPFPLRLADGRDILIRHPDFVALDPAGHDIVAFLPDGSMKIVSVSLVTSIDLAKTRRSKE